MDWTTVSQIWNDYALLIVLGLVLLAVLAIKLRDRMKAKKNKKKAEELIRKMDIQPPSPPPGLQPPIAPQPQPHQENIQILPPMPPKFSEYSRFLDSEKDEEEKTEDVVEQIGSLNKKMKRESIEIEKKIREDRIRLEAMLKEVLLNKQKLLEYGKEMSALYKVHEEREKQLGVTMVALNRVLGEDRK